ncbi:gephyrin-like molybdotransferase Glp [Pseudanabaena sp. FACHB-2040]|uniref:molybdopterin molybdotransferase MoeA n=1 Tax=Pseudanabaena sp. FACHB-2040 TaxID=2692859 RepID=UPI001683D9B0|nr:gephyrin-like molybdotransferase Glp [Pseudanabaena sp. FACHB-2040]MBD2257571.1 molybdopterin molybdotransferase MoeA [Pseudanabaena sp. FACHB-2040]
MIPAAEAEALILSQVVPLFSHHDAEVINLEQATGRILATEVISHLDFPHWDNSAMDGYAVRYEDVQAASATNPVTLTLSEEIPAGKPPQRLLQPGEAARILTGSMMPEGADTVIMQEVTERTETQVSVLEAPEPQQFVRHRASYYQAGNPLLSPGLRLNAPEVAVLAAAQCVQVSVFRRPRVAILSTGSELVTPDQPLQPGQIVDSNQYALAALAQQAGAEARCLGIVPDDPAALKVAIANALTQADIVLSSGGVSVGDYDYVDQILTDLGATLHFRAVAVQPGKPLTFATFTAQDRLGNSASSRSPLYFGLPGNPVSALVSFWRFVEPALRKLSGLPHSWAPTFVTATTRQDLRSGGKRETYVWGQLQQTAAGYEFMLAGGTRNSGNLINLAGTNALAVVPIGQNSVAAGSSVQVMLVGQPILNSGQ